MADYSIRDIARMAGVSVGTVSRILNNADNVSDEMRRRTLDVIRQVNYRDTEHYQITKSFLNGPERMMDVLFAPEEEGEP